MTSHLLELDNVTKVYGGGFLNRGPKTVALSGVSLTIEEGSSSINALAGESGSGKTTLARLLMGFITPTHGSVRYRGRDLQSMSKEETYRFRREVQPIFQDPFEVFNPFYRVDHMLWTPIRRFGLAQSDKQGRKLIEEALEVVGLRPHETLGRFPHQLSGGQRQRVMVARSLLLSPKIIVADEPVSMVDASLRATILETLRTLNEELGIVLVYITHDLTTAYQICDNVMVLYKGNVAEAGVVDRVIRHPQHPYTQLLMSSTPLPDPTKRWGEFVVDNVDNPEAEVARDNHGCLFAERCPEAMDRCWDTPPELYRIDPDRAAACFLHDRHPALASANVADVFTQAHHRVDASERPA